MITKQGFIRLADKIKDHNATAQEKGLTPFSRLHIVVIANACSDNPRFNLERWLNYIDGKCGPNGGKV